MGAFSFVWMTGTCALGGGTYELCKAWYGQPPPFAVAATLAFVVNASLAAAALATFPIATLSSEVILLYALASGIQGCLGADLARDFNRKFKCKSLAPSTVWPSDLHVESISPSAPDHPTFVCHYVRL